MHVFGALVLTCFPRVENLSTLVEKTELRFSSKTQMEVQHQVQSEYIGRVLQWQRHFSHFRRCNWTTKHRSKMARGWKLATNSRNEAFQHVSSQYCKKVEAAKSGASLTWLDHAASVRCAYTMVGECSSLQRSRERAVHAICNRSRIECDREPRRRESAGQYAENLQGHFWIVTEKQEHGCTLLTAEPSGALQQCSSKNSHRARWRETLDTHMVHGTTEHHVVMGYLYPSRW